MEEILHLMKGVGPTGHRTGSESSVGTEKSPALGTCEARPAGRQDSTLHGTQWGLVESFHESRPPRARELLRSTRAAASLPA